MDPSTDPLTDLQVEAAHTLHHIILDQISEAIVDIQATPKITKIDRISTGTTIETEVTNRTYGTTRGMGFKTGMTTTKVEIGLKTEDDQTNTNTIDSNHELR